MSPTFSMPAPGQEMAGQSWGSGLLAVAKRWWVAWIAWRIETAAIAHLQSMSDRGLEDFPAPSIADVTRSVDAAPPAFDYVANMA